MVNTTLDIVVNLQVEAAKKQLQQLNNIVRFMNTQMEQMNNPAKQYEQGFKQLQNTAKQTELLGKVIGENSEEYKQQKAYLEAQQKQLNINTNQMKKLKLETKAFSFDFLTLLFAGMMLQRTFGGMFKSIIDGYKKTVGLNSQFNRSVLKLQANFEFLKFSIANALNSPFVINAIEWFTDRLNQLSDWFSDNPGLATGLVAIIGALALIGGLSQIASGVKQIGLLVDVLKKWGGIKAFSVSPIITGVVSVIAIFGTLAVLLNEDKSIRDWGISAVNWLAKIAIDLVAGMMNLGIDLEKIFVIIGDALFNYWKGVWLEITDVAKNAGDIIKSIWSATKKLFSGDTVGALADTLKGFESLDKLKDAFIELIKPGVDASRFFEDFYSETSALSKSANEAKAQITASATYNKSLIDSLTETQKKGLDVMTSGQEIYAKYYDLNAELNTLIKENNVPTQTTFNTELNNTSTYLNNQVPFFNKIFDLLARFTSDTNKAAAAQERLNKALSAKNSVQKNIYDSLSNKSKSTTTG